MNAKFETDTPAMKIFSEWVDQYKRIIMDPDFSDLALTAANLRLYGIEQRLMDAPTETLADIGAKALVQSCNGDVAIDPGANFLTEGRKLISVLE